MKFLSKIPPYLTLLRFQLHISFTYLICAILIYSEESFSSALFEISKIYIIFNILLYGGIYIFNGIIDIDKDALHPVKKGRPLPSKVFSIKQAYLFVAIHISLGFALCLTFYSYKVLLLFLAFLLINLLYTLKLKNIAYWDILTNAVTHPLRFVLGSVIATGEFSWHEFPYIFIFSICYIIIRRSLDLQHNYIDHRTVLGKYNLDLFNKLSPILFIVLVFYAILDDNIHVSVKAISLSFLFLSIFIRESNAIVNNFWIYMNEK